MRSMRHYSYIVIIASLYEGRVGVLSRLQDDIREILELALGVIRYGVSHGERRSLTP